MKMFWEKKDDTPTHRKTPYIAEQFKPGDMARVVRCQCSNIMGSIVEVTTYPVFDEHLNADKVGIQGLAFFKWALTICLEKIDDDDNSETKDCYKVIEWDDAIWKPKELVKN